MSNTQAFMDFVTESATHEDCTVTRAGRHTGVDNTFILAGVHLQKLLDLAVEAGYGPKKAKAPRTLSCTFHEEGIQLYDMGWGAKEKAGCILICENGDVFVAWTSSIG